MFKFLRFLKVFFSFGLTDLKLFNKFGQKAFISNGWSIYGGCGDEWLFNHKFLRIGIGRTRSGRGDWGGGFEYASTCPLWITIDRDFIIHKVETDGYYNSESSQREQAKANRLKKRLKVGSKFKVQDPFLRESLDRLFAVLPCKWHIGFDVYDSPHMLEHYVNPY